MILIDVSLISSAIQEAIQAWDLILKPRNWPLYSNWVEFAEENVKAVNPDTWNMLWKFICEFPQDMQNYNEDGLLTLPPINIARLLALHF